MVNVVFVGADGRQHSVHASVGTSLMMAAVQNNVRGIDGECGGCLSCATCHVYIDEQWMPRVPPVSQMESEMLEQVAGTRGANSRLGCQIDLTPEHDGIRVMLPEHQA